MRPKTKWTIGMAVLIIGFVVLYAATSSGDGNCGTVGNPESCVVKASTTISIAIVVWLVGFLLLWAFEGFGSNRRGSGPPPGWYDDPQGGDGDRWWDGNDWTDHTRSNKDRASRSSPSASR